MILEYTEGCTCNSLSVDGVETIDIDINDFKEVIHELVDREIDLGNLQSLFMDLLMQQGECECSNEPCDQCGDYVVTYKLEI